MECDLGFPGRYSLDSLIMPVCGKENKSISKVKEDESFEELVCGFVEGKIFTGSVLFESLKAVSMDWVDLGLSR